MFGFLQSENSKLRSSAKNWLYLGRKVYSYRKDQLTEGEISELGRCMEGVRVQLKSRPADAGKLRLAIEGLEAHLRKIGGAFYPQSSLSENVDFALYFLILYLGVTAFFIKPFKIPTNSMWPSFNGMTSEVWTVEEPAPGLPSQVFRLLAHGAIRYNVEAPADGELQVPVQVRRRVGGYEMGLPVVPVPKRHHLIIPGTGNGYIFKVGNEQVLVKVPMEFELDKVMPMLDQERDSILGKSWFPSEGDFWTAIQKRFNNGASVEGSLDLPDGRSAQVVWVKTGLRFKKGDTMLSFDIHTGDQLFVDRMSYHFVEPKVGDGFVFRTGGISALDGDKYYIKRLAGTPGDRMKLDGEVLRVNGSEPDGSVAFAMKNTRQAPYDAYSDMVGYPMLLRPGEEITVPEDSYVALGDNSSNSWDSRGWGYVPESMIVGRPIMIFYPFTKRFGRVK